MHPLSVAWYRLPSLWTAAGLQRTLIVALVALVIAFVTVLVWDDAATVVQGRLDVDRKDQALTFIAVGMGGILVALQALMSYKRASALEDTSRAQVKANEHTETGQRQERLRSAIEHLGHASESVRLGGAYELLDLARDTAHLREPVFEILCAHIRRTTSTGEYRTRHHTKPSEEVQSLLTLLFAKEHSVFAEFRADLQDTWLRGAQLKNARLSKCDLTGAVLESADLSEASLSDAFLISTNLRHAVLEEANLQRAWFFGADLRSAYMNFARMERADLSDVNARRADFSGADMQETNFSDADLRLAVFSLAGLQLAVFQNSKLQGADFSEAEAQGTNFEAAQMQSVNLFHAGLQGAHFSETMMHGAHSEDSMQEGEERVRSHAARATHCPCSAFGGHLKSADVENLVKPVSRERREELREMLSIHVGKARKSEPPDGVETGMYTVDQAEQWLRDLDN